MKASVLLGDGWEDHSLEVLWRDADRAFCRLQRPDVDAGRHAFIPIHSGADHPTLESLNRLTHEYELREYLDRTWADVAKALQSGQPAPAALSAEEKRASRKRFARD